MPSLAIKTIHMVELTAMEFRLVLLALGDELKDKDVEAARKLRDELVSMRDSQVQAAEKARTRKE